MREQALKIAAGAMTAALGVVLMVLGAAVGLGTYLSPMLAGLCLIPAGRAWGVKYHLLLWAAVGLLCLMLVPDVEQDLMFLGLLGWYPALRPRLQKLAPVPRLLCKLLLFNAAVIALEALLLLVLVPETLGTAFALLLLAVGNVTFVLYDAAIPRFEVIMDRYFGRFFPRR